MIDKFKINWTESSRLRTTTSITGYGYQLEPWKEDYLKRFPKKEYMTKLIASVENADGTLTISVSRSNQKTTN